MPKHNDKLPPAMVPFAFQSPKKKVSVPSSRLEDATFYLAIAEISEEALTECSDRSLERNGKVMIKRFLFPFEAATSAFPSLPLEWVFVSQQRRMQMKFVGAQSEGNFSSSSVSPPCLVRGPSHLCVRHQANEQQRVFISGLNK